MNEPFYVTTPIYYVNDEPHIGHAYLFGLVDGSVRHVFPEKLDELAWTP